MSARRIPLIEVKTGDESAAQGVFSLDKYACPPGDGWRLGLHGIYFLSSTSAGFFTALPQLRNLELSWVSAKDRTADNFDVAQHVPIIIERQTDQETLILTPALPVPVDDTEGIRKLYYRVGSTAVATTWALRVHVEWTRVDG